MTQVSKITSNGVLNLPMVGGAVPALSKSDHEVLQALSSTKILAMSAKEVSSILNSSLSRAYYHLGFAIPEFKEMLALITYLSDFIKSEKSYENICIDEVTIAIKRGSDKQYGEFFGINPATVTGWIKAFVESESRKAAKLMQQVIMQNQNVKTEPTPEEQKEAFIQRLEMLYIFHQTGKEIARTEGTWYFEKLWSAGVIRFTDEVRKELKQKAYDKLTASKNPKLSQTKDDYNRLKIVYDVFLKAGLEGNDVKREAMYYGLLMWFDDLKTFEREIRDEII